MSKKPSCFRLLKNSLNSALVFGAIYYLAAGQAQALAIWIGSWDYVLRHDQDGKPQAAFARLRGDNDSLLWLTCSRFSAGVDRPETMSMTAAVSEKGYLGRSAPRGRSTVYWFDNGSPELSYWTYQDRVGQLVNSDQVAAFLEKLFGARSLVIELSNYRLETLRSEFRFNESDTRAVAERFRQDCRDIADLVSAKTTMIR